MNFDHKYAPENLNLEGVEFGFIVNSKALRKVLRKLKIDGRRWWIAGDPGAAVENGLIRVEYGDPHCSDLLNTIFFRLPVLNGSVPRRGTDRIVMILNGPSCIADQPGRYRGANARIEQDELQDFVSFFTSVEEARIDRLQNG